MKIKKILKFSATWCGPCKVLAKSIDESELVKPLVEEYDVEENDELADKYNIRSVPTLIFIDEAGNEIERINGSLTKIQLEEKFLEICDK